jgi:hypothetical protein
MVMCRLERNCHSPFHCVGVSPLSFVRLLDRVPKLNKKQAYSATYTAHDIPVVVCRQLRGGFCSFVHLVSVVGQIGLIFFAVVVPKGESDGKPIVVPKQYTLSCHGIVLVPPPFWTCSHTTVSAELSCYARRDLPILPTPW